MLCEKLHLLMTRERLISGIPKDDGINGVQPWASLT
jgi:hypothetical protein